MLEVIALSLRDALDAQAGGADRLEVTIDIDRDGLTPPTSLVEEIVAHVRIPVRIMLRPRDSFCIADADELAMICDRARSLAALSIEGFVLGWLRDGAIDFASLRAVVDAAPGMRFTFHRAIERVVESDSALDVLCRIPQVDTILHSGGVENSHEARVATLRDLHTRCAARGLKLLAGGGMNAALIDRLRRETPVRAFHVGSAVRPHGWSNGIDRALLHTLTLYSDSLLR